MKKVLLVCGTGASSGFMAVSIRKAIAKRGVDISIEARSDSVVESYINDIDLLLVGPHLKYMLPDLQKIAEPYHVPVEIVPQSAYGALNGEAVLDLALQILGE